MWFRAYYSVLTGAKNQGLLLLSAIATIIWFSITVNIDMLQDKRMICVCFYFILFYFILSYFYHWQHWYASRQKNDMFLFLFLFYFILFYFILFYFILFYFILFYLILFYLILSHFILFYFILFYFILFYFILFYFILFYLFFLGGGLILLTHLLKHIRGCRTKKNHTKPMQSKHRSLTRICFSMYVCYWLWYVLYNRSLKKHINLI